jgi:hypothetical protein
VGSAVVNLADNTGLDDAIRKIRRELEQLPHIGTALPKTWRDVRVALEADAHNYITAERFFDVCEANGFTHREDMLQLGGYLHDLGICLFFQDDPLLSKTVILKPEWGTAAVYRVLDDPVVAEALGVFSAKDLQRIWSGPSFEAMRADLLQLMVKFGLCFQVPGSDRFIAPQLLSPVRPAYVWDDFDNLELLYEYEVMPKGIVRRLIVALHDLIPTNMPVWRNGVVLEVEASKAEVVEEYRRRRLRIRITAGDSRIILGLIDHALGVIHKSYESLKLEKYRPCVCQTCSSPDEEATMFKVRDLEAFASAGALIQCRSSRLMVDPAALLSAISPKFSKGTIDQESGRTMAQPSAAGAREVFVSYSWGGASEALVDEIEVEMRARGVSIKRDRNEIRYRDSIQQFMRHLGAGKCVIVVLDKRYLESKNCMFELTEIAQRPEFAARVCPVVMDDARISDPLTRLRYIHYWEDKIAELDGEMKKGSQENLQGVREEIDLYARIRTTIAGIMGVLGDMNTLTPETHRDSDFTSLYQAVDMAIAK